MAAVENFMENTNNTLNITNSKQDCTELTTFTKYSKLVPELREHAVSYSKLKALKEYSQCSKLCNTEIQKHNTVAPQSLKIIECGSGIEACFHYDRNNKKEQIFPRGCTMNRDVEKYVLRNYKYVKSGKTNYIYVFVDHWPVEVMEIGHLANAYSLSVQLNQSMLNDFLHFSKTTNFKIENLLLHSGGNKVTLPAVFFKSEIVKNVSELKINLKCEIDKEDFVRLSPKRFYFKNWIEIDFIQEKILNHINAKSANRCMFNIFLPEYESRVFEINELFPADRFPQREINERWGYFEIGLTIRGTISGDKKNLTVWYHRHH